MTSEWDGTAWGGSTATRAPLPKPVRRRASRKAITGPFAGHVEFGTYLAPRERTPQALMARAQAAYHQNPWIGSAEAVVTRRVSGLPWHLEDEADEEYEEPFPPAVKLAFDLLERPQKALPAEQRDPGLTTRRALISLTSRHIGLCGMSYWYLDQTDATGIPLAILYLNPARVWAAVTEQGKITGWVVDPADDYGRGGTPLRLDEVLPFYLDPPDRGAYGTGLYERAMQKAQITNLADRHAAYVLGTGGRLAGIVAPKEGTIPDVAFDTLVKEFRTVNEAPDAAKRTTILRGPIDFIQTAASPSDLNLIELDKMNRDDIFAVWGVPPSQAGISMPAGLNSGETKAYDEAILMQGAVHDRVVSLRETIQFGLLDRWQDSGITIDLEIEEPEFDDRSPQFAIAKDAVNLPLTNAERREIVGFAPFGDARDEEVWLPALQVLAYSSGTTGPQLPNPLPSSPAAQAKAASKREFLGLRRTIDTRWVPRVRNAVAEYLAGQRTAVAAKLRSASPDTLARHRRDATHWISDAEAERLRKLIEPIVAGIAESVGERTNAMLKESRQAKADPFTESVVSAVLRKVGGRIKNITQTTQEAVAQAVQQGYDEGLSPGEIADRIETLPAFDPVRAELVARTETMFAYNDAALTSYAGFGVSEVQAIDGDEDEVCAARDGQTYSLADAQDIEDHPNGTLDWLPVLGKAEARPVLNGEPGTFRAEFAGDPGRMIIPSIHLPPPIINLTAPDVHVTVSPADQPAPQVTVNVPAQPPPQVTVEAPVVNMPAQKAADVMDVRVVEQPKRRSRLVRDASGEVLGSEEF